MSDLHSSSSFVDYVLQMGFPFLALQLAYQATKSHDSNILLEYILTHENEIHRKNTNEPNAIYLVNPVVQKLAELGFCKSSVELAQRKTKSNDLQVLIESILRHDSPEEHISAILSPQITTNQVIMTTKEQELHKKIDNTLLNDLLKLDFDVNDIENCFIDLNVNTTTKINTKTKRIEE
ncbi:unnamed protein product [Rotaria sp. Silwood2]|nr:unnamed protein product [Rotaria sp. Silwood2]CAF2948525.1 unnamed protein product [Rotaria sp. Silwood2]CAF4174805.1 unnamed protein product [Rotaria sp. Silwood2]